MAHTSSILPKTICTALVIMAMCWMPVSAPARQTAAEAAAVLKQYCLTCHNERLKTAGLVLSQLDTAKVQENPAAWEKVVRKLRTGTMPPPGSPRPERVAYDLTASWLETELDRTAQSNPGKPALRRLNRAEYGNAIRDLLDLRIDADALLPPDDSAFGFDNIGDLLEVSPVLLERYLATADRISALAIGDPATPAGSQTYHVRGDQSQAQHLEGLPLGTVGGLAARHNFPLSGEYEFRVSLLRTNLEAIRGLEHSHQLEITVDSERVLLKTVGGEAETERPGTTITERSDATDARLRVRVPVTAGPHDVAASFVRKIGEGSNRLRPFVRSNSDTYESTGRPHVETLTVLGPFTPSGPGDTPSRRRIFICRPENHNQEEACARRILSTLAQRAYRRPASAADLELLLPFYKEGRQKGTFETGIQLALRRLLASPTFVFRAESDPENVKPGAAFRISDLELATRLSFFLWSSIPDDTLIDLAARNRLRQPGVLEEQIRRMLADPRGDALSENFAGQWLHLRNLDNKRPNTDEFPDFDNDLRVAFRREAELFFASIMREDRSILDLLTADYTFVDERLARHYGIPNVYGSRFRRVTLGPELSVRRGLLGKGGILMATSQADRTSPVLRGKWILENLLGTSPPPPPADVPPLDTKPGAAPRTIRERMAAHRQPACAGCHQMIDPLGFALESFDGVGAWRTQENGRPIDSSARLADGTEVNGVVELRNTLVSRPDAFAQTVTEKMLIYALGRGLQHYDMAVVRAIVREARAKDYSFSSIVLGIVRSTPFQMRAASEKSSRD
jgi:cytochrome c551/c552